MYAWRIKSWFKNYTEYSRYISTYWYTWYWFTLRFTLEYPDKDAVDYDENDRGVSVIFGEKVVMDFNKKNDLDLIIRAHQVVDDGYEFFANRQLITIFSAPNYCGEFDNSAGIMIIDDSLTCSLKVLRPVENLKK